MADAFATKQAYPAGNTLTDLYTVPGATSFVGSSLCACNQSSTSPARVRAAIAIAGAADTRAQYFVYDAILVPNETKVFTIGVTLATTDVVRVQSDSGMVSFNLFGAAVT